MTNIEDVISISKPGKDQSRGIVTAKQAAASLKRGLQKAGEVYGFELEQGDPRCTIIATRREGDKAIVTFGARGRMLDADQLAYELNN